MWCYLSSTNEDSWHSPYLCWRNYQVACYKTFWLGCNSHRVLRLNTIPGKKEKKHKVYLKRKWTLELKQMTQWNPMAWVPEIFLVLPVDRFYSQRNCLHTSRVLKSMQSCCDKSLFQSAYSSSLVRSLGIITALCIKVYQKSLTSWGLKFKQLLSEFVLACLTANRIFSLRCQASDRASLRILLMVLSPKYLDSSLLILILNIKSFCSLAETSSQCMQQ